MKNGHRRHHFMRLNSLLLVSAFILAVAVLALPFYSASSSSLRPSSSKPNVHSGQPAKVGPLSSVASSNSILGRWSSTVQPPLPVPSSSPETIEIFAADCTTPKTSFILGETVCAKTTFVTETNRFVNWLSPPDSHVAFGSAGTTAIITNAAQDFLYTPTVTGLWKATIADPMDSSIIPAVFEVIPEGIPPGPVGTYASGCLVPQSTFILANDVCAKVTGGLVAPRRITWVDPSGFIRRVTPITTDPQNDTFSVPGTPTTTLDNGAEVTNLGTWRVNVLSSRGSLVAFKTFFVRDSEHAKAEIAITKLSPLTGENIPAGSTATFTIVVLNNGPDTAQNVVITDVVPDNTKFVSIAPSAGCTTPPVIPGTGTITCSAGNLPRDAAVSYDVSFSINAGTPQGTVIFNTASVNTGTAQANTSDDSSTAFIRVTDTGSATCTLDCPDNMTVRADTTQAGHLGAFVTFSAAAGTGDCGAISNSPGSGSFFTVGTHLITSMAESGDTCTFTVTVVDTPPPTITCPVNKTVTAASGQTSATVAVGNPTTNPSSGVTVIGIRSDDPNCTDTEIDPGCTPVPLTDPYPLGTTTITWTVIQGNGQRASCVQRITVLENNCGTDTEPPTLRAPLDVTVGTGPDPTISKFCSVGLDDELGTVTVVSTLVLEPGEAHDNCSVTVSISGIPLHNEFPVGTTILTYTATDGAGNTNTTPATQVVTVFDNTPPIIVAPPDASYTCLSEVPTGAAAIAQAHGDNPALPNGGPPTDNCGAPVITYSDSSTGAGSVASPLIITRTFTATDTSPLHNSSIAVQTITVIDPTPPTIVLNQPLQNPQYVECHTFYPELGATAEDNCGNFDATPSGTVDVNVPGTYTITYNATDAAGNVATSITRTVIVQDTIAPTITLNSYAPSMWPPNHDYQTFTVTNFVTAVTDACDTSLGVSSVVIEKVTSDEAEDAYADGATLNDIVIDTDCKSLQLRSERSGTGDGRVYTITFRVRDASGNTTTATAKVVVPHNTGETPVNSGPHYTVNGTCP